MMVEVIIEERKLRAKKGDFLKTVFCEPIFCQSGDDEAYLIKRALMEMANRRRPGYDYLMTVAGRQFWVQLSSETLGE